MFGRCAYGICILPRRRSPVAGSRQRTFHLAAERASRGRSLLQSARATDNRRQAAWREALRDRYASVQHRQQGGLLAIDVARHRSGGAARDVQRDSSGGSLRPEFMRRWVNWEEYLREEHPGRPLRFDSFIAALKELYSPYTPEFAEQESGASAAVIVEVAHEAARGKSALATHVWRNAAAGNLGRRQVARAMDFLVVLMGAVGTPGGTNPNTANKFVPMPPMIPAPPNVWNEMMWPREFPIAFYEMSFLLPHFLREGRGKLAAYFTRVHNPVWTNPDGMSWIEALSDESKVERHACLTPIWSETAWFADYVLPMGHASERHDLLSQETHCARWIGFRQPVLRVALEKKGRKFATTLEAHREAGIGEVWEEDEFWIELSWRIDPDGALGIRKNFESPYRADEKLTVRSEE